MPSHNILSACPSHSSSSSSSFVQHLATRRPSRRKEQNRKRQQETFSHFSCCRPSPPCPPPSRSSFISLISIHMHILTFICMTAIISGPCLTASASAIPSASVPSHPAHLHPYISGNHKKNNTNSGSSGDLLRKSLFPHPAIRCPAQCSCDSISGRKRVSCTSGGMTSIPTTQMDRETNIIIFSGTADHPNDAAIGRIFMELPNLQEIRITYSGLPMIGESTFWPGRELLHLDLSNNRIDRLKDSDFNPLSRLETLNLSDNQLHEIPSASFRFLTNLSSLSLSRNRISKLVPRMFYKLDHLEHLDLSENPLTGTEVSAVIFQDIHTLKSLRMEKAGIKSISHLLWQELPSLRELHLQENNLSFLGSYEFSSLSSLKSLHLDGNRLSIIRDNAFFGLRLTHLGLSRNLMTSLPICAFCNLQVESLDLSSNRFTTFQTGLLRPLSLSLIALNAGSNSHLSHASQQIANLLSPLRAAQIIKISWNHLNDSLPDGVFDNLTQLHSLDLSQNHLSNITASWFSNLGNLESLDLSYNLIHGLDPEVLMAFQSISTLKSLHLQNNPWICKRCRILPLMDWIHNHSPPAYFNTCLKSSSSFAATTMNTLTDSPAESMISPPATAAAGGGGNPLHSSTNAIMAKVMTSASSSTASAAGCVMCSQPDHLSGRALHTLSESDLEFCPDPRIHMRLTASEPRIGLIMAVIIITSICLFIMVIAIAYKFKQAAVYYTHEEERFTGYEFSRSKNHSNTSPNHHPIYRPPHHHHNHHHHQLRGSNTMGNFHQQRSHSHHHHHQNPLKLSRSFCFNSMKCVKSKNKNPFFGFMQASSSSTASSPTTSSSTTFPCTPFAHRSSSSPMFAAHSNSFTRKFTNYKSPFKSPFKCSRAKSSSSNHSTSPLSQSSNSSYDEAPAQITTTTMTKVVRPKVRF